MTMIERSFGWALKKEETDEDIYKKSRGSFSAKRKDKGISPVFLLFIDCVHQLKTQFPLSFQVA
jgi:hypothetical protein